MLIAQASSFTSVASQKFMPNQVGGYTRYLHLIITGTTFHWVRNRRQVRLNSWCNVRSFIINEPAVVTNLCSHLNE